MSKGNTFENDLLRLVFQATAIANLADNAASSPATSLYVSLHSADPGEAGSQTTSELSYTGYARKAVARSGSGWTVTNNRAENAAAIAFDPCTAGTGTAMFWAIGTGSSGTGKVLYRGPLGTFLGGAQGESSDDVVTIKAHGLSVDDRIVFFAPPGYTLPTGITEGTVYYVKTAPTADTITISTTSGGSTLDITADGTGVAYKVTPLAISAGITPQFAAGALVVDED